MPKNIYFSQQNEYSLTATGETIYYTLNATILLAAWLLLYTINERN